MLETVPKNISDVNDKIEEMESFSDMKTKDNLKYFMVEGGGADIVAKEVKEKMKMNQLRRLFEKIKKVQRNYKKKKQKNDCVDKADLYPLLPELAYAYGRDLMTKEVYELLKNCINKKVETVEAFNSFVDFLSAVIAYHKFHKRDKGGE